MNYDASNQNQPNRTRTDGMELPGGRVLLGIFGGGVPNPDPTSDQNMPFSTPVFRPGLKKPYPFSDLTLKISSC